MKNIVALLILTAFLISCGKEDTNSKSRDCIDVEYGNSFDLQIDNEVCFPDGNSIQITKLDHHFCTCEDIVCIWGGGLFVTFSVIIDNKTETTKGYADVLETSQTVFTGHDISSVSYTYGTVDEEIPNCAEDFDPEKIQLTLTISPQ